VTRTLVLGGSRSGKSRFAESLMAGEPLVEYVATAAEPGDDPEWAQRIAAHRDRRPPTWRTTETADVAAVLDARGPAVLVDSVTTWLARAMDDCGVWSGAAVSAIDARVDALVVAWSATDRRVVAVSDEVGSGVVPPTESGRLFRDTLGVLNQRLAAAADEVQLVVAGLPLRLR
jgi:adenosylcobinamide kinase/adenosylcobinamide-phosphate guanylyltransferase